ncbi:MAG: TIR domain-containing protein [Xenococcus sp. MO_188.B8]|nr:TIR domain-containing protein [Xenococcus sp. MO_188.B8]
MKSIYDKQILLRKFEANNLFQYENLRWNFKPQLNFLVEQNQYHKNDLIRLITAFLIQNENYTKSYFGIGSKASARFQIEVDGKSEIINKTSQELCAIIDRIPILAIPKTLSVISSISHRNIISLTDDYFMDLAIDGANHFLYNKPYDFIDSMLYSLIIDFISNNNTFEQSIFSIIKRFMEKLYYDEFTFHSIKTTGKAGFSFKVIPGRGNAPISIRSLPDRILSVFCIPVLIYYFLKSLHLNIPAQEIQNEHGIVFIEDVEVYLNSSLHQDLISLLIDNFPSVQFIITTDSPFAVSQSKAGEVAVITKKYEELEIRQFDQDFANLNQKEIIKLLFGMEDSYLNSGYEYQFALSFAGEDREYAEKLANLLKRRGIKVFYDRFERAQLLGKDLYQHLQSIYRDSAQYCVILLSKNYANKLWTKHELEQAQARAFRENREYILPLRLDDTAIPGINETIGYIDLRSIQIEEVVDTLSKKLKL